MKRPPPSLSVSFIIRAVPLFPYYLECFRVIVCACHCGCSCMCVCVFVVAVLPAQGGTGPDTWNHLVRISSVGGEECAPR